MTRLELTVLSAEYKRLNDISTRLDQEILELTSLLYQVQNLLTIADSNPEDAELALTNADELLKKASLMSPNDSEN